MYKDNFLKIRFFLRLNRGKNVLPIIHLKYGLYGEYAEISTKIQCPKEQWDSKSQKIQGKSYRVKTENASLDRMRADLQREFDFLVQKDPTMDLFTFRNHIRKDQQTQSHTIVGLFDEFIDIYSQKVGTDISIATLKKYRTIQKKIQAFLLQHYQRNDYPLDKLKLAFIENFDIHLKNKLGLSHNTSMKYIRFVKTVINHGVRREYLDNNPFDLFQCSFKTVHRTILTQQEINLIRSKDFGISRLNEVRDAFIFSCYTGLAYIDVKNLTPNHIVTGIDGNNWIHTSRTKTKNRSHIPLLPPAKEIIHRYKKNPYCEIKNKLLPLPSNQKMNAYLKEIADICGIKKKLTTHIARHTFATTISLSNGVSLETVSKMLGHSSVKTTQIYAKVLENKISEEMTTLSHRLFPKEKENQSTIHGKQKS